MEKEKQKVLVQNERESNDTSKIIIVILIVVQCAGSALVCVSSFVLVFSHFRIVHYSQFTHVWVWQVILCPDASWIFFKMLTRAGHNGTFGFVKSWPFNLIWDNSLNRFTNRQDRYLGEESWTSVKEPITSAQTNLFMRQPGTDGQSPRATQTVEDSFISTFRLLWMVLSFKIINSQNEKEKMTLNVIIIILWNGIHLLKL